MPDWKTFQYEFDHRQPLPPLHPTSVWDPELSDEIRNTAPDELMGATQFALSAVQATRAGLLVWNDDLDAAHELVQDLSSAEGSYWHAILHRREGDYDNAKYWFARVGEHPIFASIYAQAVRLWPRCKEWNAWRPDRFVDAVADAVHTGEDEHPDAEALRRVQVVEFSFLLRHGISRR